MDGHQERSKRAGTENVALIVGLSKAIELANANLENYNQKLLDLREYFIEKINHNIENVIINGDMQNRLPGNVNIAIPGIDSETMLLMLDMNGICASAGSACTSSSLEASHVLTAIGLKKELAKSSLRFTFGEENTIEDIDYIVEKLTKINKLIKDKQP